MSQNFHVLSLETVAILSQKEQKKTLTCMQGRVRVWLYLWESPEKLKDKTEALCPFKSIALVTCAWDQECAINNYRQWIR